MYEVTGVVSFRSKPLPYGTVVFHGPDGRQIVASKIGSDGRYTLEAMEGQHHVTVIAQAPLDLPPGESIETYNRPIRPKAGMPTVPDKYNNPSSSGLYCNVFPEENTHDIAIP